MTTSENVPGGAERSDDLIAAVQRDHEEIRRLFAEVEAAGTDEATRDAFERLLHKLVVHEAAEQELVHPLARESDELGSVTTVEDRLTEEQEARTLLADLMGLDVAGDDFEHRLAGLREEVLAHAEAEERTEHPRLGRSVEADRLRRLGAVFRWAERAAPTRPHPHGPTAAAGNVAAGPIVSVAEPVRDAARRAGGTTGYPGIPDDGFVPDSVVPDSEEQT